MAESAAVSFADNDGTSIAGSTDFYPRSVANPVAAKKKAKRPTGALISLGAASVADIFSYLHLPGGSTLKLLVDRHMAKRRKEAAEILIAEITEGGLHGHIPFEEHDVEPLIEIVLRFYKAVEEGAARDNLRFLAEVIAGLKSKKSGDAFRRWAGMLEQLTRDELLLIGKAYLIQKSFFERAGPGGKKATDDFWQQLQAALRSVDTAPQRFLHCARVSAVQA